MKRGGREYRLTVKAKGSGYYPTRQGAKAASTGFDGIDVSPDTFLDLEKETEQPKSKIRLAPNPFDKK